MDEETLSGLVTAVKQVVDLPDAAAAKLILAYEGDVKSFVDDYLDDPAAVLQGVGVDLEEEVRLDEQRRKEEEIRNSMRREFEQQRNQDLEEQDDRNLRLAMEASMVASNKNDALGDLDDRYMQAAIAVSNMEARQRAEEERMQNLRTADKLEMNNMFDEMQRKAEQESLQKDAKRFAGLEACIPDSDLEGKAVVQEFLNLRSRVADVDDVLKDLNSRKNKDGETQARIAELETVRKELGPVLLDAQLECVEHLEAMGSNDIKVREMINNFTEWRTEQMSNIEDRAVMQKEFDTSLSEYQKKVKEMEEQMLALKQKQLAMQKDLTSERNQNAQREKELLIKKCEEDATKLESQIGDERDRQKTNLQSRLNDRLRRRAK